MLGSGETSTIEDAEGSGMPLAAIDIIALEEALREQSSGSMTAYLYDVVQTARDRWGFPGTVGTAEAILCHSGRYLVEQNPHGLGRVVRPRYPASA